MKTFVKILLWVWQLPQNVAGLFVLLCLKGEKKHELNGVRFYVSKNFPGGVTLGEYIVMGRDDETTVRHEFGHVLQSRMLGPLYLFVIGIPSIIHAALPNDACCDKHEKGYYHFYTEKWADELGGVNRRSKKK